MNGELAEAILVTPCQAEKTNNASSQTDFFHSSPEDAYNSIPLPKFNSTQFQKALQLEQSIKNKAQKSKRQRMEQKRQFWSVINSQIQEEVRRIRQHQDVFDGELKNSIPYGKERVDKITMKNNFPSTLNDMSETKRKLLNTIEIELQR